MSRDLEDLETGKYVFHIPGVTPPEPVRRPSASVEPEYEPEYAPEPEPELEPEPEPEVEEAPAEPEEEAVEPEEEHEVRLGGFFRFIITAAVLAVLLYGLFTYVLGGFVSYDDRMYPFINNGDIVITYRLGSFGPGDPVVYENPDTGNSAISRIAAYGTNTIDISGAGDVLVSGTLSGLTVYETTPKSHTAGISYPYQMTADGYFLLNDHRAIEIDSRQFGEVKKEDVLGRVILVIRWKGFSTGKQ